MPSLGQRVIDGVEARLGLVARRGFAPPRIIRDRAEVLVIWARDAFEVRLSFYGVDDVRNLGIALVPPRRADSFGLHQAVAALDPELHARYQETGPGPAMDEPAWNAWLDAHARFFETHADALLERPDEVLARVREVEPLGEQCVRLVAMCSEILGLEREHGFDPPRAIHWGVGCEIEYRRGPCRVVVRLEDHEKQGVIVEPFTVPELYLRTGDDQPEVSLTERAAAIDPAHAARRPVADRHAMALDALRPWLEHDAAFLRAHPELLGRRPGPTLAC